MRKINVLAIVRDHFGTFIDERTEQSAPWDYVLFLGVPLVPAVLVVLAGTTIPTEAVDILITAVSILAGLLFNLEVLIYSISEKFIAPIGAARSQRFMGQVFANISYAIVISLLSLIPLVAIVLPGPFRWPTGLVIGSGFAVYLVVHLLLTLLMILKRMHAAISLDLRRLTKGKDRASEPGPAA